MDTKLLNLAIGKLSDDMENMKEQMKEVFIQLKTLKMLKNDVQQVAVPSPEASAEFIKINEVRKILKMSRNSILNMIKNGLIREVRLTRRTIRYIKSEILALSASNL